MLSYVVRNYKSKQATIDFKSSTTNAIQKIALEDDAVLVLHRQDLAEGGVCTLSVRGYGQHSSLDNFVVEGDSVESSTLFSTQRASQPWKDKSFKIGTEGKTVACANCCSTLGFVSNHDSNTYRLYKHLLDCGEPVESSLAGTFAKYTCGSFLAREMIRYSETEAIYSFIVGISDDSEFTGPDRHGKCILLRMLSWDTQIATLGKSDNDQGDSNLYAARFGKVLKVIFQEATDIKELIAVNHDQMQWTWGGIDLCCLPPKHFVGSMSSSDENPIVIQQMNNEESSQKSRVPGCGPGYAIPAGHQGQPQGNVTHR